LILFDGDLILVEHVGPDQLPEPVDDFFLGLGSLQIEDDLVVGGLGEEAGEEQRFLVAEAVAVEDFCEGSQGDGGFGLVGFEEKVLQLALVEAFYLKLKFQFQYNIH